MFICSVSINHTLRIDHVIAHFRGKCRALKQTVWLTRGHTVLETFGDMLNRKKFWNLDIRCTIFSVFRTDFWFYHCLQLFILLMQKLVIGQVVMSIVSFAYFIVDEELEHFSTKRILLWFTRILERNRHLEILPLVKTFHSRTRRTPWRNSYE